MIRAGMAGWAGSRLDGASRGAEVAGGARPLALGARLVRGRPRAEEPRGARGREIEVVANDGRESGSGSSPANGGMTERHERHRKQRKKEKGNVKSSGPEVKAFGGVDAYFEPNVALLPKMFRYAWRTLLPILP